MQVDYDKIATEFSKSRKNMKWEEIDYFISNYIKETKIKSFLDIWCGSARLLEQFSTFFDISKINYIWVDLSEKMLENARNNFPKKEFLSLNMLNLDTIKNKFDYIFFIASFHHLDDLESRLEVLRKAYNLLNKNWIIFMTNWSLKSEINFEKYLESTIKWSTNKFGSLDYKIKMWDYKRYYHCFDLKELEFLFKQTWFLIIENREFENKRNFISIIQKK